jgi:serine/threonine protein kinase
MEGGTTAIDWTIRQALYILPDVIAAMISTYSFDEVPVVPPLIDTAGIAPRGSTFVPKLNELVDEQSDSMSRETKTSMQSSMSRAAPADSKDVVEIQAAALEAVQVFLRVMCSASSSIACTTAGMSAAAEMGELEEQKARCEREVLRLWPAFLDEMNQKREEYELRGQLGQEGHTDEGFTVSVTTACDDFVTAVNAWRVVVLDRSAPADRNSFHFSLSPTKSASDRQREGSQLRLLLLIFVFSLLAVLFAVVSFGFSTPYIALLACATVPLTVMLVLVGRSKNGVAAHAATDADTLRVTQARLLVHVMRANRRHMRQAARRAAPTLARSARRRTTKKMNAGESGSSVGVTSEGGDARIRTMDLRNGFMLTKHNSGLRSRQQRDAAGEDVAASASINASPNREGMMKSGDDIPSNGPSSSPGGMSESLPQPMPIFDHSAADHSGAALSGGDVSANNYVRVSMDATGTLLLPFAEDVTHPIVLDGYHVHAHLSIIGLEFATVHSTLLELNLAADLNDDRSFICLWNHAITVATGGFEDANTVGHNLNEVLGDSASLNAVTQRLHDVNEEVLNPTNGFPIEPMVLSILHREHGSVKMSFTIAPVTQCVVDDAGNDVDVMVGALLLGVPLDARSSETRMSFRNSYLSDVLEQLYLEEAYADDGAPAAQQASAAARHRFNGAVAGAVFSTMHTVGTISDANWCTTTVQNLTAEVRRAVRAATSLDVLASIEALVPSDIDCDANGISKVISELVEADASAKDVSLTIAVASRESAALLILLRGLDSRLCMSRISVVDDLAGTGSYLNRALAACGGWAVATTVEGDDAIMLLFPFTVAGALHGVLMRRTDSDALDIDLVDLELTRRSTQGEKEMRRPSFHVHPSFHRSDGGTQLSEEDAASAERASPSHLSMAIMLCENNVLTMHKVSLSLWHASHSVIQVEDGNFLRSGLKVLRSGNRKIDAVMMNKAQPLSADMLRCCTQWDSVVFCFERPDDFDASASHRSAARKLVLPAPDRAEAYKQLQLLENVVFVGEAAQASHYGTTAARKVAEMVHHLRHEKQKRDEVEALFKGRSSPWVKGKRIGQGAFGDVFEAEMTLTGGMMAVKVMHFGRNAAMQDAFFNEVRVLSSVEHPNIVHYFHCERGENGEVYIFMELCRGGSLLNVIQNHKGAVDFEEVRSTLEQLLQALAYLHGQKITHRDIKPANVLISNGRAKLADFGTAVASQKGLSNTAGTMQFMSPEIFNGDIYGPRCDVWSIGVLVVELFKLKPPVMEKNEYICLACAETDEELWDGLRVRGNDAAHAFLRGCLRVKEGDRLSAQELLEHDFITGAGQTSDLASANTSASTAASFGTSMGLSRSPALIPLQGGPLQFSDNGIVVPSFNNNSSLLLPAVPSQAAAGLTLPVPSFVGNLGGGRIDPEAARGVSPLIGFHGAGASLTSNMWKSTLPGDGRAPKVGRLQRRVSSSDVASSAAVRLAARRRVSNVSTLNSQQSPMGSSNLTGGRVQARRKSVPEFETSDLL